MKTANLTIVSLLFFCQYAAGAELPQNVQDNIDRALAQFAEASKLSEQKLLQAFEKQMDLVRKTARLKPAEKQAMIQAVETEKATFEKNGTVPFSAPMREATVAYLAHLDKARTQVSKAYDKAIEHAQTKAKDDDLAANLASSKKKAIAPRVIGVWEGKGVSWKGTIWTDPTIAKLFDDYTAQSPHRTWAIEKNSLVLRFPNATAPGGVQVDTCELADDGQSFVGKSNVGHIYKSKRIDP